MGAYGHPGSSGFAQSGGRNTTFGGGKGGTAASRTSTSNKKEGTGSQNGVNRYTIRSESGDSAKTTLKGKVGGPPPVHAGGDGHATAIVRPHQRKPFLKGSQGG